MIDAKQLRDLVIIPTLEAMEKLWPGANTPAAVNLLLGTAFQESRATYLKQIGAGPALGIFQIEPATEQDMWDNYLNSRKDKADFVLSLARRDGNRRMDMICNLAYQVCVARIKYWRTKAVLPTNPNDIPALGKVWNDFYNTNPLVGTVEEFVKAYPKI
jgi:hypothetical protein